MYLLAAAVNGAANFLVLTVTSIKTGTAGSPKQQLRVRYGI